MKSAGLPDNEAERLAALEEYHILDSGVEAAYDEIAELASSICQTPIALVSLVGPDRQWFKSKVGTDLVETPRDVAFCAHAILGSEVFVVPDTLADERFVDNPLVTGDPNIRFYAGAPLVSPEGAAVGSLCAIDRVPRQLTPEQLRALDILSRQVVAQLELRRSVAQLRRYALELRQANASKDRFVSILSHDLRTPFQGILGIAQLLVADIGFLTRDDLQSIAQNLVTSAQAAYRLMENLLQWSRLERGEIRLQPTSVRLDDTFAEVSSLLGVTAVSKEIHLGVATNPEALVHADRKMLYSTVQNLVSNAIKFTPTGGNVHLSSAVRGSWVEIRVADTGIGMAREQVESLFQIETAFTTEGTEGEPGSGLGLLLCKQFVEKNGGTIRVDSHPRRGTTFLVRLPKAA